METVLKDVGLKSNAWGENIAQGRSDAASVMDSWLNSKCHRANILSRSFKQMAVGLPLRGAVCAGWSSLSEGGPPYIKEARERPGRQ
jgi:hypothetical protein